MNIKLPDYILVFVQVVSASFLAICNDWHMLPAWALGLLSLSAFLAIWALYTMQLNNLSIIPSPKPAARLVTKGPYRFIRHPMYTSLILFGTPLTLARPDTMHIIAGLALIADLIVKSIYEEKLLAEKFPDYSDYKKKTYRMIPWLF